MEKLDQKDTVPSEENAVPDSKDSIAAAKTIGQADLVQAASIIASCPEDRLPTVLALLKKAGLPVAAPRERTFHYANVNQETVNVVQKFIEENRDRFERGNDGERYGFFSEDGETVFVFPAVLKEKLEEAGYSPRKAMRYMAEIDIVVPHYYNIEKGRKKVYTVPKRYCGGLTRFVELRVHILGEKAMDQIVLELP